MPGDFSPAERAAIARRRARAEGVGSPGVRLTPDEATAVAAALGALVGQGSLPTSLTEHGPALRRIARRLGVEPVGG